MDSLQKSFFLCFGLGLAPTVFTKLIEIPISMLRKLNVRLMIFLDDILINSILNELIENGKEQLNISVTRSTVIDQHKEIYSETHPENRVFSYGNRRIGNDFEDSMGKKGSGCRPLSNTRRSH